MSDKLTAKQEIYAQQRAIGKDETESYCIAYPLQAKNSAKQTLYSNACRLEQNSKVIARIAQLQQKALNHLSYGIEEHYNELEEIRQLALSKGDKAGKVDLNAATKVTELKGKVKQLYVTKSIDIKLTKEMTDEELDRELEKYASLEGLTLEQYKEKEGLQ